METTARAGWAARAVLYLLVAVLAARIPSTGGGRRADKTGAFETIADAPLGRALLATVALGTAAFAVLRVWSAIRGGEEKPMRRLAWVGSALVYAGLSALAVGVLAGRGSGGGAEHRLTVQLLGWPGGRVLVGAIGLACLAVAVRAVQKGLGERFLHDVDESAVPSTLRAPVRGIGVAGWLGRALVWGVVGWFVVRAAIQHDASEPIGLDASLRQLAGQPWGSAVVWTAFAGLAAYGVLCIATAIWPDPEPDS